MLTILGPGAAAAAASEVKIFRVDGRDAVVEGTFDGLSVDPLGGVELARRLERVAGIAEPFVFAADAHPDGWVVGTGNSGKVLEIAADGGVTELHAASEPSIFAVLAGGDGTVYAASSPRGRVYRLRAGAAAEVAFDPDDAYVWDLALDRRGRLLVATGLDGRLYRLSRSGAPEILYESRDAHVRSIAVLPGGDVLLGTAGQGLILRLGADGETTTLHDAAHPEVVALAAAADGTAYAAVLASEASFVDLSKPPSQGGSDQEAKQGEEGAAVTVAVAAPTGQETVGSRSPGFSGPRSVVLEIAPDGAVEEIASFQDETVYSLLHRDGELWIGTGEEGRLYRYAGAKLVLEARLEDRQIVALVSGPAGAAAVTANASAAYRLGDELEPRGTYTSAVLDASQVARFGSFLWQGRLPEEDAVALEFRSGMSAQPDATWTAWSPAGETRCVDCAGGRGRGQDVGLASLAHGRYVQWRARLERAGGAGPRIESAELSYRQDNLRPEIEKLEVLDPGQILVPQSFNPTNQAFEPWSPNREGIFTRLKAGTQNGDGRYKELWKKGYRTLRWSAKDANQDSLRYRLEFRPEDDGAGWLEMAEEIEESHYSFDATVLPDGVYRFRLTASDEPSNVDAEALEEDELSEAVVIDHTPPELRRVERKNGTIEVELVDALNPMRDAVMSFDGGEWQPARPVDGLLDGRRELLRIEVPAATRLLLLRVTDAAHNVITFDLLHHSSKDATP